MPDALKTGGQSANRKKPLELINPKWQRSGFLAVIAAVVFPLKGNLIACEREHCHRKEESRQAGDPALVIK